jgi:hypothetical protein
MADERPFILWRIGRFARLLVGNGWRAVAFLVGSAYSVYVYLAPVDLQNRVLAAVHVAPEWRLAVWGWAVTLLFFWASFATWDGERAEVERLSAPNEVAAAIRTQTAEAHAEAVRRDLQQKIRDYSET